MKKILIFILAILTFIIMLPISFLFFCLLATIQQGHPVNGIIQFVIMGICAIACSLWSAKSIFTKLKDKFIKG